MSKCRGCGREIVWIKTPAGKAMPCDIDPVVYWENPGGSKILVTPNGSTVRCETEGDPQEPTGIGYVSHFSTCPAAGNFRKKR